MGYNPVAVGCDPNNGNLEYGFEIPTPDDINCCDDIVYGCPCQIFDENGACLPVTSAE